MALEEFLQFTINCWFSETLSKYFDVLFASYSIVFSTLNTKEIFLLSLLESFSFSFVILYLHISNFSSKFLRPPLHFCPTFKEMSSLFSHLLSQPAMYIDSFTFIPSLIHSSHLFMYLLVISYTQSLESAWCVLSTGLGTRNIWQF